MWKKGKIKLLLLVYNKSSFHVFKTKNVENVETRNYQRLFKIENVEEMWKKQMMLDMVISMMTEGDFCDRFQKKHNPQFYEKLKKKKTQKKKTSRAKSTKRHPVFKVQD